MRRKVKFIDKGVDSRTIPSYNRNPRQVILLDFMPGQIFLHRFSHLPKNFSIRQLFLRTSIVVFAIATQFLVAKLGFAQQDIKRGLGSGGFGLTESINGRWGYNWNYTRPNSFDGEYVPMLWGGNDIQTKIDAIKGYGDTKYVLGFNEPERPDQANLTVDTAINRWTQISSGFAGTGIKLVSPAVSDTTDGRAWLSDFMQKANANSLRVDEIAFHWYGTVNPSDPVGSANSFLSRVDQYHTTYNRKVWVTEFAGIDWNNQYSTATQNQANATFLKTAIAGLESRSYVTRYGWWNFNDDSNLATKDAYDLWRPTVVGDNYNQTLMAGDTKELTGQTQNGDYVYMRGGRIINSGAALTGNNAVGSIYAMSNYDGTLAASSIGGTGDWGASSNGYLRVELNATLRKIGSNEVSLRNMDIYNDGQIRLFDNGNGTDSGTLWISGGGTNAVGDGIIRLDPQSNLRLGMATDAIGPTLGYNLDFRGGSLTIDGANTRLTGDGTLFSQTTWTVNKNFNFEGQLFGTAGIVKMGGAMLTFSADQAYDGNTRINEGTLAVNAALGGGQVTVAAGGKLQGVGIISPLIIINNGGLIAPGNSIGALTGSNLTLASGSEIEIEIGSLLSFDQLRLSGILTANEGSTLRLRLLAGYIPSVGSEFDILDFQSFIGNFSSINAPTINGAFWDSSQLRTLGIVRVAAVPEPSSCVLLLLSGSMIFLSRRRK